MFGENNTEGAQYFKTRQVSALCLVKYENTNVISIYEEFYRNCRNSFYRKISGQKIGRAHV